MLDDFQNCLTVGLSSKLTLLQNLCQISHHTLNLLPYYHAKLECSNCVFSTVIGDGCVTWSSWLNKPDTRWSWCEINGICCYNVFLTLKLLPVMRDFFGKFSRKTKHQHTERARQSAVWNGLHPNYLVRYMISNSPALTGKFWDKFMASVPKGSERRLFNVW